MPGEQETWAFKRWENGATEWEAPGPPHMRRIEVVPASRVQELEDAARELVEAIDFPNIGIAAARREQAAVEKLRKLL